MMSASGSPPEIHTQMRFMFALFIFHLGVFQGVSTREQKGVSWKPREAQGKPTSRDTHDAAPCLRVASYSTSGLACCVLTRPQGKLFVYMVRFLSTTIENV